jgi:hypothetical protein
MSTAEHITFHGAQINLGDLPPYLTYATEESTSIFNLCHRGMKSPRHSSSSFEIYYRMFSVALFPVQHSLPPSVTQYMYCLSVRGVCVGGGGGGGGGGGVVMLVINPAVLLHS